MLVYTPIHGVCNLVKVNYNTKEVEFTFLHTQIRTKNNYKILRCSELKDTNGSMIYENNIVSFNDINKIATVKFINGAFYADNELLGSVYKHIKIVGWNFDS